MPPPSPETLTAFDVLAPYASIGQALCEMAGLGRLRSAMSVRALCTALRLPQTRAADLEQVLDAARSVGLFEQVSETTWRTVNEPLAARLCPLLEGVALYRYRVHRDTDLVDVVLTKPPKPSVMADALERTIEGSWGLQDTKELLPAIAESARESFTVLSPFLDEVGAGIVANLFERASVPDRVFILRSDANGSLPPGLMEIRPRLAELGVKVLDFHLDRPDGRGFETFHAKVVLADRASAYLGSANMLKWSFEYSLELGLHVRGKAAGRIADVLRAIESVSTSVK